MQQPTQKCYNETTARVGRLNAAVGGTQEEKEINLYFPAAFPMTNPDHCHILHLIDMA